MASKFFNNLNLLTAVNNGADYAILVLHFVLQVEYGQYVWYAIV